MFVESISFPQETWNPHILMHTYIIVLVVMFKANGQYKLSSELFGISPDEKGDAFMRKVSQCVNGTIMLGSAFQKVALTESRVAATLKYHACMEKSLLDIQRGSKSSVASYTFLGTVAYTYINTHASYHSTPHIHAYIHTYAVRH